ncbi:MAG: ABC transporter permease [Anaerolineae bacterium]|nr:MAG: ABC transporter permease [Anaerolineae bacterium]
MTLPSLGSASSESGPGLAFRDLVKNSFSNLGRHRVRTALSAVGVTVGIVTIVTMVSLGIGVRKEMLGSFDALGLETLRVFPVTEERTAFDPFGEPPRKLLLTDDLVDDLRARDDVLEVRPSLNLPRAMNVGLELSGQMVIVRPWQTASGPADPFVPDTEFVAGEEPSLDAVGVLAISTRAVKELGVPESDYGALIGQEVTIVLRAPRGDSFRLPLRLAGIFDMHYGPNDYAAVTLGLPARLEMLAWWYDNPDYLARRGYDMLRIRTVSLNDATQILALLETRGFRVQSVKMMLDMVNRATIVMEAMLGSVGALALFVASIGIANTMVMAVYERTREIGILKAVGASPGDIRALFVVESALIGLLGGIVGTVAGWLLGKGLDRLIRAIMAWQEIPVQATFFLATGWLVVAALGFAMLVGLLAGLYPAARAARLDPLDALRHE